MAKKDKVTEIPEEVLENKELQETPEAVEGVEEAKPEFYLDNGEKCSRSAYIRQQFEKGMSRQDIAKELGVKYYVVYSATANMFNEAHPADSTGTGRGSVSVPKVNSEFKFVDAEGNVVETAEEAVQVPRADLMRELADAGVKRNEIKDYFGVAYATVYAATKDASATGNTRERKMVTDPETGEVVKRNDYIRKLYADGEGMDRKAIAKLLTDMTDELVDYATVWAATKPKKEDAEVEETKEAEVPEEAVEEETAE